MTVGAPLAVVTGASTGIGLATATLLSDRGFRVLAGVRTGADADRLTALGLEPLHLDVTDPGAVDAAAEQVGARLDVLVNNAGIAVVGPVEMLTDERLREQFDVNLFGLHRVTRGLLPALFEARGRIVNISSISGRVSFPFFAAYAGSKYAVEAYSDALRREVRASGVRVSLVEPGEVDTPLWEKTAPAPGELEAIPTRYRARVAGLARSTTSDKPRVSSEDVALAVHHAATSGRPRIRYAMPRRTRLMATFVPMLPARLVDAIVDREFNRMA